MSLHKDALGADIHETKFTLVNGSPIVNLLVASAAGVAVVDFNTNLLYRAVSTTAGDWVLTGDGSGAAADASSTVKGITKLSVNPVSPTNPIAVGDNDREATALRTTGAAVVVNTASPGTTGQVLTLTSATAANWQTPSGGSAANPVWVKITKAYTDLSFAGLTNDIELYSMAAGYVLGGVKIKHTTAFTGGAISAYTVSVGVAGNLAKYASAFDVFQVTGNTVMQTSDGMFSENQAAATSVRVAAVSVGANLDQASAGSVDIWLLVSAAV